MPTAPPQPTPEALYRMRVMIWAAMLFSIAMYGVIVRIAPSQATTDNPELVQILLLVAVAVVAASFGVKSYFFKRAREAHNAALTRVGELVALVLCESAALFGLVAWFLTASPRYYWFLILGAVGQLLHYPRREE